MIEAPVLHVNATTPRPSVLCTQLALDYRQQFNKDVVVDIVCFRKLGHNEQDTPSLTQPLMYKKIAQHPGTRKLYADKLVAQDVLPAEAPDDMIKAVPRRDGRRPPHARPRPDQLQGQVRGRLVAVPRQEVDGRGRHGAADGRVQAPRPSASPPCPRTSSCTRSSRRCIADRAAMGRGEINVDWGMGEHLAFASLVASGYPVRVSGEDSGRGTFTHRHAVLHDQNREKFDTGTYVPLQNIAENQAPFVVIDSILSEEAVLAFEYGYASADPNTLVIWEAQFGDFVNGAQVVIDQFIASGEVKWGRANGLALMLPHGYEGQGPEHSSARLERFMQMAADTNMQIVQPTTASQIFHVLRRQMVRTFRKPLVIMTPKSLLRNKDATSPMSEFTKGEFRTVIPELDDSVEAAKVKRVVACSGKVYYDLVKKRLERKSNDVAIIRVEQLYPFPHKAFAAEMKKYPQATEIVWCQDEPQNQGAWFFVQHYIHENMLDGPEARLRRASRLGLAGGGLRAPAPGAAEGAARPGVREAQGLHPHQVSTPKRRRAAGPARATPPVARRPGGRPPRYPRVEKRTWPSSK
jgi:2-oxoglutarate dehydrogenase E1 component